MTSSKKLAAAAVAILALLVPAVAAATSEHASVKGFPEGYLAMNPKTCKFLQREIDQPLAPTWKNLRKGFIWEDARHDAKISCLTKRVNGAFGGVAGAVAGYAQVKATGPGHTVTATCPNGDIVLGGGNVGGEVAGSYPSSNSSWTIVRAHDNHQTTITVIATCPAARNQSI